MQTFYYAFKTSHNTNTIIRYVFNNNTVCSDSYIIANFNTTDNFSASTDENIITNFWRSLTLTIR